MVKILIFALFAVFLGAANAQGNCGITSCGKAEHIDCWMADGAWGTSCPSDKNMLNLAAVTDQIVGRHNYHRNRIAGGLISGYDTATQMGCMSWNITLANLARKNVRQCAMKHDACHNLPEYDYTGQNLAYKKYRKTVTTPNIDLMIEMINDWDAVKSQGTKGDLNPYKGNMNIATFTQMQRDTCGLVGCAAMVTEDATWRTMIFGCNYAMGNIYNWPTYKTGKTASACKTGTDSTYKNLCSTNEPYNYKKFWEA